MVCPKIQKQLIWDTFLLERPLFSTFPFEYTLTVQKIEQRVADQERTATDQAAVLIEKVESTEKERQQSERTARAAEAARAAMQETLDTLRGQLEAAR